MDAQGIESFSASNPSFKITNNDFKAHFGLESLKLGGRKQEIPPMRNCFFD
jgi:hypothetical protein